MSISTKNKACGRFLNEKELTEWYSRLNAIILKRGNQAIVEAARINVRGIPKSNLLAALYNRAYRATPTAVYVREMSPFGAQMIIDSRKSLQFENLADKVLNIDLSFNSIYTDAYNKANGENAAEEVVAELRKRFPE